MDQGDSCGGNLAGKKQVGSGGEGGSTDSFKGKVQVEFVAESNGSEDVRFGMDDGKMQGSRLDEIANGGVNMFEEGLVGMVGKHEKPGIKHHTRGVGIVEPDFVRGGEGFGHGLIVGFDEGLGNH